MRFSTLLLSIIAVAASADDACRTALSSAEIAITATNLFPAVYGDFNEDGRPDVYFDGVTALNRGSVFEPLGRRGFAVAGLVPVATADVDHDRHLDVIERSSDAIVIDLGRGDGAFQPQAFQHLSRLANAWRIVDLSHDGIPDFVDFNPGSTGSFTFLRSSAGGTYEEAGAFTFAHVAANPIKTTAGDFDGDGNVDVVRLDGDGGTTALTFGWNDGTFHFTEALASGVKVPNTLLPIDLDGDGADELAVIDDGALVILRAKNRNVTVDRIPVAPAGMAVVLNSALMLDVDDDGIRDLVFAGPPAGVLYGTASKRFRDAFFFDPLALSFTAVDLDGDGLPDLASTGGLQGLSVVHGAALRSGKPDANRIYAFGFPTSGFVVIDVDGDGHADIIGMGAVDSRFTAAVLFGDGKGELQRLSKQFVIPSPYAANTGFTGDFDGDGRGDLAMTLARYGFDIPAAKPVIAFGTADGFGSALLALDAAEIVGTINLNPASPPALVAVNGNDVQLITISPGRTAAVSTIAHLDPARKSRVVVVRSPANVPAQFAVVDPGGSATLVTRSADGGWHEGLRFVVAADVAFPNSLASADFDGDGLPDLVVADLSRIVTYSSGSGTSARSQPAAALYSVAVADVDRDGLPDVVVANPNVVQMLRNTGTGFEPYAAANVAIMTSSAVADVDGDGRPDVVVATIGGAELIRNVCAPARIHVEALPFNPAEGTPVKLLIHAAPTIAAAVGRVTISEGNKVLDTLQAVLENQLGTFAWTSPPLSPGSHTFRIDYVDAYSGTSQTSITVTTRSAVRRRSAGR